MTALFMDGFDHYGLGAQSQINMQAGPYAAVGSVVCGVPPWGPPRTGAACLVMPAINEQGMCRRVLPLPTSHLFVSFGFAVDSLDTLTTKNAIAFDDGAGNILFELGWTSTGALVLRQGNGNSGEGPVIAQTPGPVIVPENWHFFEMEVNTTTGTFTLRVDDAQATNTPTISVTGNAAIAGSIAQISPLRIFTGSTFGTPAYMDDLFVRDALGTTNNSWLGDRRIATLMADGDTTQAGWSPRFYHQIGAGILNDTAANACVSSVSTTSLNIGAGDFTIESFVRFQAIPGGVSRAVIFGKWDETNNQRSYQFFLGSQALNGGALCFQASTDGNPSTVAQPIVYPFTPELDRWYHMAVVRASGELLLFVDGQQLGLPIADASTYFAGAGTMAIGGQVDIQQTPFVQPVVVAGTCLQGWFDETRFTVGFARYTANFTPPAVALPRGAANDPKWADVALLCGYDSLIQDESSFNRALTARAAVQQTVFDGPAVGTWSTVGKAAPDDNTFVEAPFLVAGNILTLSAQPAPGDAFTIGAGSGAAATATVAGGAVTAYAVTSGGSFYANVPAVTLTGGGGVGATATATVVNGVVTAVVPGAPGTGYTSAPAVAFSSPGQTYTWVNALTDVNQVLIDANLQQTLQNTFNAINAGPGSGSKYGAGTVANINVNALQLPAGQMAVAANTAGAIGNVIATTASLHNGGGWASAHLTGGVNIPEPSDFKVQRPPALTTIISAVQVTHRTFKSDAGLCSAQSGFVGPLGGVTAGPVHGLTVSPSYYGDIYETDPDTGAPISPATLINGRIRLNRTV